MKLCRYNSNADKKEKINFSSPRYSSGSNISFKITIDGWEISCIGLNSGTAKPCGNPTLYSFLDHDAIEYPTSLPYIMETLWRKAHIENFDNKRLRTTLYRIAYWVDAMNCSTPNFQLTKKSIQRQSSFANKRVKKK